MSGYWSNFIKSGSPNDGGLTAWPLGNSGGLGYDSEIGRYIWACPGGQRGADKFSYKILLPARSNGEGLFEMRGI